jgi:hypothetical protein
MGTSVEVVVSWTGTSVVVWLPVVLSVSTVSGPSGMKLEVVVSATGTSLDEVVCSTTIAISVVEGSAARVSVVDGPAGTSTSGKTSGNAMLVVVLGSC